MNLFLFSYEDQSSICTLSPSFECLCRMIFCLLSHSFYDNARLAENLLAFTKLASKSGDEAMTTSLTTTGHRANTLEETVMNVMAAAIKFPQILGSNQRDLGLVPLASKKRRA